MITMVEIYRDSTGKAMSLDITGATVNSAQLNRDWWAVPIAATLTGGNAVIPYDITKDDGAFEIIWNYTVGASTYERTDKHYIVTPYATLDEIKAIEGVTALGKTDAELQRVERRIRGTIDRVTLQNFGRFDGSLQIVGAGETQLQLPRRLALLQRVEGSDVLQLYVESSPGVWVLDPDNGTLYAVRGDGWYLGASVPTPEGDYVFENVIRSPDSMYRTGVWRDNVVYTITGVWGYEAVPSDINEAALILIEDELCPDGEYRDRYVQGMGAGTNKIQFHNKAWLGTGSARADDLLSGYRRNNMLVI